MTIMQQMFEAEILYYEVRQSSVRDKSLASCNASTGRHWASTQGITQEIKCVAVQLFTQYGTKYITRLGHVKLGQVRLSQVRAEGMELERRWANDWYLTSHVDSPRVTKYSNFAGHVQIWIEKCRTEHVRMYFFFLARSQEIIMFRSLK